MKHLRILFVTLFVVIADQLSKLFVKGISIPSLHFNLHGMLYAERINIIGSFLRITFVENPGMAFGIDLGISSKLFLSIFSIAASIGILYYLYRVRNDGWVLKLSLALILGGAIGNLIDRIFYGVIYGYAPLFYGRVVDFIDVDFFNINLFGYSYDRWPIFNIADMSVSVGVIILLLFSNKFSKQKESESILLADTGGVQVNPGSTELTLTNNEQDKNASFVNNNTEADIRNNPGIENDKPDIGKKI
jgi:signal peptidase II